MKFEFTFITKKEDLFLVLPFVGVSWWDGLTVSVGWLAWGVSISRK